MLMLGDLPGHDLEALFHELKPKAMTPLYSCLPNFKIAEAEGKAILYEVLAQKLGS